MADTAGLGQRPAAPTVAGCAELCLKSFKQCLNQAAAIHDRELSLVEDQLARFSLWSSNIKVFISGRGSLDYRLREAPDIRDAIAAVLEALDYRVQGCFHILDSLGRTNRTSLATIDDKLQEALRGIANEISLLHKFSNTIRRAGRETQDRRAVEAFKIKDDEGNDAESFLLVLFGNYVRDRLPGASSIIVQRLASSMLQRRKRILHRRSRYGEHHIRPQGRPLQSSIVRPQAPTTIGSTIDQPRERDNRQGTSATQNAARSVAVTATTLYPQAYQKASAPSAASARKSVALDAHQKLPFPPAPCGSLQRKYKKLKAERERQNREELNSITDENVGLAPRQVIKIMEAKYERILASEWEECLQAVPELICPFCFCALPVREVIDEEKWRFHVKNDLDPYICMFEECRSPDELYKHSHEWLQHMRAHSLRWRCALKSHDELVCTTADEYLTHMKIEHGMKLTDAQSKVLAERSGRMIGPMFKSCPLCGEEKVDGSMENHIVGHLRFFALKSLPSYEEHMEGLDESDSGQNSFATSRPQTRSTIRDDRDKLEGDESEYELPWPDYRPPQLAPPDEEDGSIEFVDLAWFEGVPSGGRVFEWGFAHGISGVEIRPDDPVALAFSRPRRKKKKVMIWMDPNCAICHAPAEYKCDCEARGLQTALQMAEYRMMNSVYSEIREWAREHAKKYVKDRFARTEDIQPQDGEKATKSLEIEGDVLSPQEQRGTWETPSEQHSEALDYFFGLVKVKLPAEDDPAMRGPPAVGVLPAVEDPPTVEDPPATEGASLPPL